LSIRRYNRHFLPEDELLIVEDTHLIMTYSQSPYFLMCMKNSSKRVHDANRDIPCSHGNNE